MEYWDLYDINRQKTGQTMVRGDKMPEGLYHLVVHVCLFNSSGEMLIQQRQPFKRGYPNLWDVSMGGSAVTGDTSIQAAEREVLEELGLTIHLGNRLPNLTIPFAHGFDDWYVVEGDPVLQDLVLQEEEVQAVRYATQAEILSMIDDGSFIPYRKPLIPLLFNMHKGGEGAHFPQEGL